MIVYVAGVGEDHEGWNPEYGNKDWNKALKYGIETYEVDRNDIVRDKTSKDEWLGACGNMRGETFHIKKLYVNE
jgi:hypothetical protein